MERPLHARRLPLILVAEDSGAKPHDSSPPVARLGRDPRHNQSHHRPPRNRVGIPHEHSPRLPQRARQPLPRIDPGVAPARVRASSSTAGRLGLLAPDGRIDGEWRNAQIAGVPGHCCSWPAQCCTAAVPARRGRATQQMAGPGHSATVAVPALATLVMVTAATASTSTSTGHQHTIDLTRSGHGHPATAAMGRGHSANAAGKWRSRTAGSTSRKAKRDGFELQWSDT
jgi:hypothetical protein